MRSHWSHRLAGLAAICAIVLAAGSACLSTGTASAASATRPAAACPLGTHWDDILQECI
jgi:hypothetical protein